MKYFVIGICVLVVLTIALISMKKTKTEDDFVLGNRSIGPWIPAFAYGTTYFSAVLFIGYAGKVGWGFGMSALTPTIILTLMSISWGTVEWREHLVNVFGDEDSDGQILGEGWVTHDLG